MNNSVNRAIRILKCISEEKNGLTITNLSRMLSCPKSSVFDIVHTLHAEGFIELTERRTYVLGLKLFQLGIMYINNLDLSRLAKPILEELRDKSNETVYLAKEHMGKIVYMEKIPGKSQIMSSCDVGAINDMHSTGLGKALLASYQEDKVRKLIGTDKLKAKTVNTISTLDGLLKELKNIRKRGYSTDRCEDFEYICCVAAPIFDKNDEAIAAISISSLSVLSTPEKERYYGELVADAALKISRLLGYTGERLYTT